MGLGLFLEFPVREGSNGNESFALGLLNFALGLCSRSSRSRAMGNAHGWLSSVAYP